MSDTYKTTYDGETSTKVRSYTYDKADRLIAEETAGGAYTTYGYNADGSLDWEETNGARTNYEYECGRLTRRGEKEFAYDNLGNCTNFGGTEMTWHRGNLLKSIGETSYLYDAQGTRYAKTKGNERTEYFRDGGKIIEEHRGNARIRYLYDAEGIMGFKVYQEYYYFLKDVQGNVRSVVRAHQNIAQAGFVVDEVARYEYDAWGNATSSNFNNAKIDGVDVAEFNPIRWKSQYYDTESGLYYINGRYYSPETKRYVDSGNPETALANAATIYGLNLQNSTLTNPVNELYNEYTIETQTALTYDPPKLTKWQAFWRSKWGNATAALLLFVATVLTLEFSLAFPIAAGAIWAGYGMTFGLTAVSLGAGAAIAGYRSSRQGKGFWNGFGEYIHDNWAQEAAITSALYIVSIGISLTKYAIANAVSKKSLAKAAISARDAKIEWLRQNLSKEDLKKVATVVGGYNKSTKEIAVAVKNFDGLPYCAETLVVEKLGGMESINDIVMTAAIRPSNLKTIPLCKYCRAIYSKRNFLPGVFKR